MLTKEDITKAAYSCLDFYVRNQVTKKMYDNCGGGSADCGRFCCKYDHKKNIVGSLTICWETSVLIEAMLMGYAFSGEQKYFDAAKLAVDYLKSLQNFHPAKERVYGVFCEMTPQSTFAHPRDTVTTAWAMLDWYEQTGDTDSFLRVKYFADWYVNIGLELGYPYWTAHLDDKLWDPTWCGSFHSGAAFFLYRMFINTGDEKYKDAMFKVLDFYNSHHLDSEGQISVILDRETHEVLDNTGLQPRVWEIMHQYNDDFGALANLAAFAISGNNSYKDAAERFLRRMATVAQRDDGGFGPDSESVPSAAGVVLIEALAAKKLGLELIGSDSLGKAVKYLLNIQIHQPGKGGEGAFLDNETSSCARTGA